MKFWLPFVIFAVCFGVWFEATQQLSDFERGQYYFNHDDDPGGPYDVAKAQYFYERAIAADPEQKELLWYQSGRIDFINGDFDTAIHKFERQVDLFGDRVPAVYYMLGLTYGYRARHGGDTDDWRLAEIFFEKHLDYASYAAWPRVDLAWVYFSQGKYEEMKPVLEPILERHADNPWVLNMYGLAMLNTAEPLAANEYFNQALVQARTVSNDEWGKIYPGNNPAYWDAGRAEFVHTIEKNIAIIENLSVTDSTP